MSDLDRVKGALARLLAPLLSRFDYAREYPARVVAQNADGSLELAGDAPQLASLSKVPIQYGVPGISATIASGGEVLVGWLNADPAQPYCIVHDRAQVTSIALLGGTKPVARIGDGVRMNLSPMAIFTGTVSGLPFGPAPAAMANPFVGIIQTGQAGAQA